MGLAPEGIVIRLNDALLFSSGRAHLDTHALAVVEQSLAKARAEEQKRARAEAERKEREERARREAAEQRKREEEERRKEIERLTTEARSKLKAPMRKPTPPVRPERAPRSGTERLE